MTDKEIIKALEVCGADDDSCSGCHFERVQCIEDDGTNLLILAALDLINRKKVESNKYRNKAQLQKVELARLNKQVAEKIAEIERLKDDFVNVNKMVKSEAIKEFWNRLKKEADFISGGDYGFSFEIREDVADNIIKEMEGAADA